MLLFLMMFLSLLLWLMLLTLFWVMLLALFFLFNHSFLCSPNKHSTKWSYIIIITNHYHTEACLLPYLLSVFTTKHKNNTRLILFQLYYGSHQRLKTTDDDVDVDDVAASTDAAPDIIYLFIQNETNRALKIDWRECWVRYVSFRVWQKYARFYNNQTCVC